MLDYSLKMPNPNSHCFEVEIEVPSNYEALLHTGKIHFIMPTWTPGSYLIREFSRNVLDFSATDPGTGKGLESFKISKNVWEVETSGSKSVRVKYLVYAFEFTVDTSYLDGRHAVVNGASVFMYVEGLEREDLILKIIPHPDWNSISTGLSQHSLIEKNSGIMFKVPNYDLLVDSPIEIGNQTISSFLVDGVKHEVSIFNKCEFLDETRLNSDLKKIVETTVQVFSDIPYQKYVFIIDFVNEGYGGLEHLNSTYCIAPIFRLKPFQEYTQLLSLFSHEFFHAWNVKRMRPKALGPFEYSRENYTKSLWIAEGITSYYDDLIIRRAGLYNVGDYLDAFCSNISLMKSLPGGKWQSAEEASFDAWIKHYRQDENSPNVLSSYYLQGTLIGWMIDMEMRRISDSSKDLDDVMRELYLETYFKEGRGFTDAEFERKCAEYIGQEITTEIFQARVRGREEIDFGKYLGYAGLKLNPKKQQTNEGFLGVRIRQDAGKLIVANVLATSPAESCGLSAQDEIIAADGLRMDSSRLVYYIANKKPSSKLGLLISRLGGLLETNAVLASKPVMDYRIVKLDSAGNQQEEVFNSWLGADWNQEIKYSEYAPSPAKKLVLDYV